MPELTVESQPKRIPDFDPASLVDFVPVPLEEAERRVEETLTEIALAQNGIVEPFGVTLAIEYGGITSPRPKPPIPPPGPDSTAGPTGPKGEGQYDDYKKRSE